MKEIYEGLLRSWNEQRSAVLATIIHVSGSSYRKEGARCLIFETGEVVGMISGGCVEADLLEHTKDVLISKKPKKIEYDFRWDEDNLWGMGLGCNGAITVWLEPFDPIYDKEHAKVMLDELAYRLTCESPYPFVMVINSSDPEKYPIGMYLTRHDNNLENVGLIETVIDNVQLTLYIETVSPLPNLFVIGTGPDAALLAKRANDLDWKVTVIDHRESYLTTYFPNTKHQLIKRGEYSTVVFPENSFVVLMTHNLELDQMALQHLLSIDLSYLGVLGSRQRISRLVNMVKAETDHIEENAFHKIHSPIGLDIGAESPEEITLSILSELTAHKNGREGGSLCKVK